MRKLPLFWQVIIFVIMEGYNVIRFLNVPLLQLIVAGSSRGVKGCLELSHVLSFISDGFTNAGSDFLPDVLYGCLSWSLTLF